MGLGATWKLRRTYGPFTGLFCFVASARIAVTTALKIFSVVAAVRSADSQQFLGSRHCSTFAQVGQLLMCIALNDLTTRSLCALRLVDRRCRLHNALRLYAQSCRTWSELPLGLDDLY